MIESEYGIPVRNLISLCKFFDLATFNFGYDVMVLNCSVIVEVKSMNKIDKVDQYKRIRYYYSNI